jgi:hypothetical protein
VFNKGCICWWKEFERYQNARYNNKKKLMPLFESKRRYNVSGLQNMCCHPAVLICQVLFTQWHGTIPYPRRTRSSSALLWKPEDSQILSFICNSDFNLLCVDFVFTDQDLLLVSDSMIVIFGINLNISVKKWW